jgi:uncharacterized membrane protein
MTEAWPAPSRLTWWGAFWGRFWALPLLVAATSLALGIALPELDSRLEQTPAWVFEGGVDGARSVLGTIAGAMISVTGLVFSITIVVLQLASSQFSPRILRSFLQSRVVQLTLGVFTGSFLYALTVLRAVRGGDDGRVPQLSVTAASAYVVVAVGMFLAFIHHITTSVQVAHVMASVRRQTVAAARRLAGPEEGSRPWSPPAGDARQPLHNGDRSGYVTALDRERLVKEAHRLGGVVELELEPGDHLAPGQRIGWLWGASAPGDAREGVSGAVHLASERDVAADPGFGVRQLLDIADRALSPGVNDPTTAVQAVNELHVVLTQLAGQPDPPATLVDDGRVVAVYRPQTYGGHLDQVVTELLRYGGDSDRVVRRLRSMLLVLLEAARPEHKAATTDGLARVSAADSP